MGLRNVNMSKLCGNKIAPTSVYNEEGVTCLSDNWVRQRPDFGSGPCHGAARPVWWEIEWPWTNFYTFVQTTRIYKIQCRHIVIEFDFSVVLLKVKYLKLNTYKSMYAYSKIFLQKIFIHLCIYKYINSWI